MISNSLNALALTTCQRLSSEVSRQPSSWQTNNSIQFSFELFQEYARHVIKKEVLLSKLINEVILSPEITSMKTSICILLARHFHSQSGDLFFELHEWKEILINAANSFENNLEDLLIQDLLAIMTRDPASRCPVLSFLNYKGFKALQAYRIANILLHNGSRELALLIQSRVSELWDVDIHPGATIGGGLMIDHGTGLVIGETAVIGGNCSFLHGVTLGSTGKDMGDRHPKIGDDVLIGCHAIVLGNITIGRSSKIGSGSVVIKSIPENVTVVGNPARIIGRSVESEINSSAAKEMDLSFQQTKIESGAFYNCTWSIYDDGTVTFDDLDVHSKGYISRDDILNLFCIRFGRFISNETLDLVMLKLNLDKDGIITKSEFDEAFHLIQPLLKSSWSSSSINKSGTENGDAGRRSISSSPKNANQYQSNEKVNDLISAYFQKLNELSEGGAYI